MRTKFAYKGKTGSRYLQSKIYKGMFQDFTQRISAIQQENFININKRNGQ